MSSQEDSPASLFPMQESGGGQSDDRYLWPEMLRVIDEVRPTWVVGENVAGITTMVESCEVTDMGGEASLFEEDGGVHRFRSEHTFTIERICRDLESKGYSIQPVLIPACAVGAPHRRDRVFIIAHNAECSRPEYSIDRAAEEEVSDEKNERGQVRLSEQSGFSEAESSRRSSPNSDCRRGSKVDEYIQSELSDGTESFCNGGERNVADTQNLFINGSETRYRGNDLKKKVSEPGSGNSQDAADTKCKGLQEWMSIRLCENREEEETRVDNRTERFGYNGRTTRMLPTERWEGFPSVSPVHRGNDGLPFDVDNLTIPFSKWRTESLKAYGNAIVPQVMYRIFQCIEQSITLI